jgi:hypothetical protein
MNHALRQFNTEITNFFIVALGNIVIAALTIAFVVQYIVGAVIAGSGEPAGSGLRIVTGAVALTCFGLGISWITVTIRVFEGVESIRDMLSAHGEEITDEEITGLIVRMLALYRDEREAIRKMILISAGGGICFLFLGVSTGVELLNRVLQMSISTLEDWLLIPEFLLMTGIAVASLFSSYDLLKFSARYDRRLGEIAESECTLQSELNLGER